MRALSQRLSELGHPLLPSGITKIEQGKRGVDVDDLVALARALEVRPEQLLSGRASLAGRVLQSSRELGESSADVLVALGAVRTHVNGYLEAPEEGASVDESDIVNSVDMLRRVATDLRGSAAVCEDIAGRLEASIGWGADGPPRLIDPSTEEQRTARRPAKRTEPRGER